MKVESLGFSMEDTLFPLGAGNWAYDSLDSTHNLNFGVDF